MVFHEHNEYLTVMDGPSYWYSTSGEDLKRMMQFAGAPLAAQRSFLNFHHVVLCPALGNRPDTTASPAQKDSVLGWDGNPFEYSFEFKGSNKTPGVRFAADFSQHRPGDVQAPLDMSNSQNIIQYLSKRIPGFDNTWGQAFHRFFVCEDFESEQQRDWVDRVGFQTPMMLGFDIKPSMMALDDGSSERDSVVPVMLKSYYLPHYTTMARNLPSNWDAISTSIRQLPNVTKTSPNILKALEVLESYISSKPESYRKTAQYMATDFVDPSKARLKIYFRHYNPDPGPQADYNFDDLWDYYTLGGRIPDLEDDKSMLRDLIDLVGGHTSSAAPPTTSHHQRSEHDHQRWLRTRAKPVAFYFSLTPDKPYPTSKIYYNSARSSKTPTDLVIARGIDSWMDKYGWNDGGLSVEDRVQGVFSHRKLEEKNGIFTFIAFGRKDDGGGHGKKGISLSVYVTPELYDNPRF